MNGIYVLVIQISEDVDLAVGRLGVLSFSAGIYAYIGSAQRGLKKRVERHLRHEKRLFWHIDYLLQSSSARVIRVFWKESGKIGECKIAIEMEARGEGISGFGCSDCKCRSHLFRLTDSDFLFDSMNLLV